MIIKKAEIEKFERLKRVKLINSICGVRGVHLIGTKSQSNICNLAIFSSVTHLGSNPPLLSFVSRPSNMVKRDTINNIQETKYYTINSIHTNMIKNAHQTSGKYHFEKSEFKECDIKKEYIDTFPAPFVDQSNIKIGLKLIEKIIIKHNKTQIVIGEIILIKTKYQNIEQNFRDTASIIGLNSYYKHKKLTDLPYVKIK